MRGENAAVRGTQCDRILWISAHLDDNNEWAHVVELASASFAMDNENRRKRHPDCAGGALVRTGSVIDAFER